MNKIKSSKGVIIAIVAAVAVVCVAGVAAFALLSNTPQARLAKGFAKWSDVKEDKDIAEEVFGIDELLDSMMYGATKKDLSLDVTLPLFNIPTMGVDLVDSCDYPNQKYLAQLELSVSNIELMTMQIAADAEKFYISLPSLLEDTYHVAYEEFAENFNNSVWAEILELNLEEDVQINPWIVKENEKEAEEAEREFAFSEEFMEAMEAKAAETVDSMIVEDAEITVPLVRNGKTVECDTIRVVVSKDDINDMLDMIQEELENGKMGEEMRKVMEANGSANVQETMDMVIAIFDVRFVEDFQVEFCLDKSNTILQMKTPQNVVVDNGTAVGLTMDFAGGKKPATILSGDVIVVDGEVAEIQVEFACENTVEGTKELNKFEMDFAVSEYGMDPVLTNVDISYSWDNETHEFAMSVDADEMEETVLGFAFECKFDNIVKGESLSMEIGRCIVNYQGTTVMKMTGDYMVQPLAEEVKIPAESVDALEISQMGLQKILFEILGNAGSMSDALEELNIF